MLVFISGEFRKNLGSLSRQFVASAKVASNFSTPLLPLFNSGHSIDQAMQANHWPVT
jgi:hypothetical protein